VKRQTLIGIALLLVFDLPHAAFAGKEDRLAERFSLSVGGFFTNRSSKIRVDSFTSGTGSTLDFQDDLGLDESVTIARLDGYYRFGRRHRLGFSYYDLSRSATRVIGKQIKFGDTTFTSGTLLSTTSDIVITKLAYSYSAIRNNTTEVGLSLGLHVLDIDLILRDKGTNQAERESGILPLPVIGLRFTHALKTKLFIKGGIDLFAIDTDSFDGRLIDRWIALEHNTYKNVGFGVAYNNIDVDLNANSEDIQGRFDLDYSGLQIYLKFYF